jgi:hypothetical protein
MWQMTDWGKTRDYASVVWKYLFDKPIDLIPEGASFVLEGMGLGHFYLEKKHIYYNPSHRKSFSDGAVAEWKE